MGYEPSQPVNGTQDELAAFAAGQRSVGISIVINAFLTLLQLAVGLWGHAYSLVADSLHSLSDLISDGFVLVANRRAREPADVNHPYGHGRIETATSLLLGLVLVGVGVGFLVAAGNRLQNLQNLSAINPLALGVAVLTLLVKEGLFRYQLGVGERLRSPMLVANAWHQRADAASSLVVAVGIGGSLLGFAYGDLLAAAIVGFMILRMGLKFSWEALGELIDTGLPVAETGAIRKSLLAAPGVLGLHDLRTRRMARHALVDAHVQVAPRISVSEGHRIAEEARGRVLADCPFVLDVLVHIDSEPDGSGLPGPLPPCRPALTDKLAVLLEGLPPPVEVLLHYLGGKVEVEVFFFSDFFADPGALCNAQQKVDVRVRNEPDFRQVRLNCRVRTGTVRAAGVCAP